MQGVHDRQYQPDHEYGRGHTGADQQREHPLARPFRGRPFSLAAVAEHQQPDPVIDEMIT